MADKRAKAAAEDVTDIEERDYLREHMTGRQRRFGPGTGPNESPAMANAVEGACPLKARSPGRNVNANERIFPYLHSFLGGRGDPEGWRPHCGSRAPHFFVRGRWAGTGGGHMRT